jgi:hypothetical protein
MSFGICVKANIAAAISKNIVAMREDLRELSDAKKREAFANLDELCHRAIPERPEVYLCQKSDRTSNTEIGANASARRNASGSLGSFDKVTKDSHAVVRASACRH